MEQTVKKKKLFMVNGHYSNDSTNDEIIVIQADKEPTKKEAISILGTIHIDEILEISEKDIREKRNRFYFV